MRYYFLRLLSLLKTTLGYLMSKIASAYNKLGTVIKNGVAKEETRIVQVRDRNIDNAKRDVIVAAQRVLELEQRVGDVASKEEDKAQTKLFKLKTKVQ